MNSNDLFLTAIATAKDRLDEYRDTAVAIAEKEFERPLTDNEVEVLMFGFIQGAAIAFFERIHQRKEPDHKFN
jgi:hypothetical protein